MRTLTTAILLTLTVTSGAHATDSICDATVLRDTVGDYGYSLKQGETISAITQYRVNKKTGASSFCSHGGGCYPAEALRLTNCEIEKVGKDFTFHGVADDETYFGLKLIRSKVPPDVLRQNDVELKLLELGLCSACADNAAAFYIKRPASRCAKLVLGALEGEPTAVETLKSRPNFCVLSSGFADNQACNDVDLPCKSDDAVGSQRRDSPQHSRKETPASPAVAQAATPAPSLSPLPIPATMADHSQTKEDCEKWLQQPCILFGDSHSGLWWGPPASTWRGFPGIPHVAAAPSSRIQDAALSGRIFRAGLIRRRVGNPVAPFRIKTAPGARYFFKLISRETNQEEIAGFIIGGTPLEAKVPPGTYELRYAAGATWIDETHYFGPETSFSKTVNPLSFSIVGNEVHGVEVELILQTGGNLQTRSISKQDF